MPPPSLPLPPPLFGASLTSARLGGKLTADLVLRSPQYMNCLGEYEIDLRGKGEGKGSGLLDGSAKKETNLEDRSFKPHFLTSRPSVLP